MQCCMYVYGLGTSLYMSAMGSSASDTVQSRGSDVPLTAGYHARLLMLQTRYRNRCRPRSIRQLIRQPGHPQPPSFLRYPPLPSLISHNDQACTCKVTRNEPLRNQVIWHRVSQQQDLELGNDSSSVFRAWFRNRSGGYSESMGILPSRHDERQGMGSSGIG